MTRRNPFRYFKTSPEIIRLAVMLYVRFPLSLRNVEDLLHERGIDVSHETARFWWNRFGPMFAAEIARRDKKAALKFPRILVRRFGRPREIVTDRLPSYGAVLKELGIEDLQSSGRWLNNRVETSHLPLRRRERAMLRFGRMRSLQTFAAVHSSVFNHFNQERDLSSRNIFKLNRPTALEECRHLCAA